MKSAPLGEVATIERHGIEPSSLPAATRYLGLEHIERGGRIIGSDTVGHAELASTKFAFTPEHVLYGKLRPNLGKVSRPTFAGVCSTDILPIRPGPRLDRDYLAHYLSQPMMIDFAASRTSGANLPRLSPTVLGTFEIPLPPLDEQRRIAAVLDRADALRAMRREMFELAESFKTSAFADLFGSDENGFRGFDQNRLGAYIAEGPQNGLYKPSSAYGRGTPIVRIDSFKDGGAISDATLKRVLLTDDEVSRYALHEGDLVINRVNAPIHLGKSTCVGPLKEKTVYESNMMRLRLDTERIKPEYVLAFLQTPYAKRQISGVAKAAVNQSSINQADVQGLQLPVPPVTLQFKFVDQLKAVERVRLAGEREMAQLDELFASLQQLAFTSQF